VSFPIETPGDLTRLRFGLSGRVNDKTDAWTLEVSFDGGKTFKSVGRLTGPARFASKWVVDSDVPPRTRKALVRYSGEKSAAAMIFNLRIDADYMEPQGGVAPVRITYVWEEKGQEKRDVHVTSRASESYKIRCDGTPKMKSVILERVD